MSLCVSTMKQWLSQLWVADALWFQAKAYRDLSTLPSRGSTHHRVCNKSFGKLCLLKHTMCFSFKVNKTHSL